MAKKVKPEEMLKIAADMQKSMEIAKRYAVYTGYPQEESAKYPNGLSVIQNAAFKEYGTSREKPRSVLRMPFEVQRKEVNSYTASVFKKVFDGSMDAFKGLNLIGIKTVNIVRQAFDTRGFGRWEDIKQSTKDAKGSSGVLIDTGLLRKLATFVIRKG